MMLFIHSKTLFTHLCFARYRNTNTFCDSFSNGCFTLTTNSVDADPSVEYYPNARGLPRYLLIVPSHSMSNYFEPIPFVSNLIFLVHLVVVFTMNHSLIMVLWISLLLMMFYPS